MSSIKDSGVFGEEKNTNASFAIPGIQHSSKPDNGAAVSAVAPSWAVPSRNAFPETATADGMYEGTEPYLFISYSHKDSMALQDVLGFLEQQHMRYWYDNGLHSGDDWNLVIARHLEQATVCLLLLSENSARSDYVKNELYFALNHRIQIHILLLERFELPIDVEIMIGRIQNVEKTDGYEDQLLRVLPPELIVQDAAAEESRQDEHPLFAAGQRLFDRQGTVTLEGHHKTLEYPVLVQQDVVKNADPRTLLQMAAAVSRMEHPLFFHIIDVRIDKNCMWSYLEYHNTVFLDDYLKAHRISEDTAVRWADAVIDGMEYLSKRGYAVRDFARGSVAVTDDADLRIMRLHHAYYGVFKIQPENRQYYIEKEIQEIAALLYQLCTGEIPVLPIRMITQSHLSGNFLKKVNLIIQKAAIEKGRTGYSSLDEMRADLAASKISLKDQQFLAQRKKKLEQYQKLKDANRQRFTAEGMLSVVDSKELRTEALEEDFGFGATVFLSPEPPARSAGTESFSLLICSTGQALRFSGSRIVIGRDTDCDVVFTQPIMSRRHAMIERNNRGEYCIKDLHSSNGTFVNGQKVENDESVALSPGCLIKVGSVELKFLPSGSIDS